LDEVVRFHIRLFRYGGRVVGNIHLDRVPIERLEGVVIHRLQRTLSAAYAAQGVRRCRFTISFRVDMSMESSIRMNAKVFELPTTLGILQRIEGVQREEEQLGVLKFKYKGVVASSGCKRGICIKYKALVLSSNGREWRTPRQWARSLGAPHYGGCLTQATADALWDIAERGFEVGLWYDCAVKTWGAMMGLKLVPMERYLECTCGVVVNGVRLGNPYCRTAEVCVELILEDYRREVERMREPPTPPPESAIAERLLKEWPELEAFGLDWLRAWAPHAKERLVEAARLLRRYPRLAELIKRRPANLNPYSMEIYVARDGSEVCASFGDGAYCSADGGAVRRLDLELKGSEPHEGGVRGVYRPKGLLAFAARAKEYVRIL